MTSEQSIAEFLWMQTASNITAGTQDQELFVLSHGLQVSSDVASTDVLDQALRAYRLLRMKKFYLRAPKRCLRQVMKQGGRVIKRLRKEIEHVDAELAGIIITQKHWWTAGVGNMRVYLYRKEAMLKVLPKKDTGESLPTIGSEKKVLWEETEGEFSSGDILLILTHDLAMTLSMSQIAKVITDNLQFVKIQELAKILIEEAVKRRKQDGYGVLLIRKL